MIRIESPYVPDVDRLPLFRRGRGEMPLLDRATLAGGVIVVCLVALAGWVWSFAS